MWNKVVVRFCRGLALCFTLIHSHPQGRWNLSDGDEKAMEEFLKLNPNISYSIAIIVTKHDYKYKKNNNEYIFEFDQYKKICCFICYLNEGKLVNNPIKPNIIKENDQELLKI